MPPARLFQVVVMTAGHGAACWLVQVSGHGPEHDEEMARLRQAYEGFTGTRGPGRRVDGQLVSGSQRHPQPSEAS